MHAHCSLAFAQQSARQNLQPSDVRVDDQERARTLELLHRLETGEGVLSDDEDGSASEEHDLTERMPDLDHYTPEQLFSMLSLSERQRFQALRRDPQRAAQVYFQESQDDTHDTIPLLWWQRGVQARPWLRNSEPFISFANTWRSTFANAKAPVTDLGFNILAVLLAYAFVLRHVECPSLASILSSGPTRKAEGERPAFSSDDEDEPPPLEPDTPMPAPAPPQSRSPSPTEQDDELCESVLALLRRLVPFLFAPPRSQLSKTLLTSAEEAGLCVLQNLGYEYFGHAPGELLLSLFRDVQPLLSPRGVIDDDDLGHGEGPFSSHAHTVWALADLFLFLDNVNGASPSKDDQAVPRKVLFYVHALQHVPEKSRLQAQVEQQIFHLESESDERKRLEQAQSANRTLETMDPAVSRLSGQTHQAKIQELDASTA